MPNRPARGRGGAPPPPPSAVRDPSPLAAPANASELPLELEQVGHNAVGDRRRDLALALRGPEESAVLLVGRKSGFHENRRTAGCRQDEEWTLLHAAVLAGMDRSHLPLPEFRESRRFAQVFVELQVIQNEPQ